MNRRWVVMIGVLLLLGGLTGSQVFAGNGQWMMRTRLINIDPDASGDGDLRGIDADSNFTVEADLTYFFAPHWAIEGLLANSSHEITIRDTDKAYGPGSSVFSLGSISMLMPTVVAQYHFLPDGKVRPYIGAGINYTSFSDQTGFLDMELSDLDSSFGIAGQAGVDFMLDDSMSLNVDIKYIQMDTDINSEGEKIGTLTIDPWVFGVGFGWHF